MAHVLKRLLASIPLASIQSLLDPLPRRMRRRVDIEAPINASGVAHHRAHPLERVRLISFSDEKHDILGTWKQQFQ